MAPVDDETLVNQRIHSQRLAANNLRVVNLFGIGIDSEQWEVNINLPKRVSVGRYNDPNFISRK
jgi:hypothetical protein